MSEDSEFQSPHPLRSAAWVISLALIISSALFVSHLWRAWHSDAPAAIGDGRHVDSYGFALSPCLVPCEEIVAAGLPRDGLPALVTPALMNATAVDSLNAAQRGKYLVPDDRVIGLVLGGAARAYPLRVLNWHEVVNDTLGGLPIVVTYNPLCDSSAGFSREVAGETLEFGVSGLLWNSNLLMYDRRTAGGAESLWSQLQARAVTGPAAEAGQTLTILPLAVVSWGIWRTWHPETTVLFPEPERRASYKRAPYVSYFGSDRLRFPVAPLPADDRLRLKDRVVALPRGDGWLRYAWRDVVMNCDEQSRWVTSTSEKSLRFFCRDDPPSLAIFDDATGALLPAVHSFWFAWHAAWPAQPPIR